MNIGEAANQLWFQWLNGNVSDFISAVGTNYPKNTKIIVYCKTEKETKRLSEELPSYEGFTVEYKYLGRSKIGGEPESLIF